MTLEVLFKAMGPQGQAVITLVLSLPFVFFIPLPGLSIVFGAVILLNGYRIARKKTLWLPQKYLHKKISGNHLAKSLRKTDRFLFWLEKYIRPRGGSHPILEVANGWTLALCGFFLLLPLPPGTNFLPGLAATLLSIGILEEDLLFVLLGYIAFGANLLFFILVPLFLAGKL